MLKQTKNLINELIEVSDKCTVYKLTTTKRLQLQREIKEKKVTYFEYRYATPERVVWQDPEGLDYGWLWKRFEGQPKEKLIDEMTRITLAEVKKYKKKTYLIDAEFDGKQYYGFINEKLEPMDNEVSMFAYMYEDLDEF